MMTEKETEMEKKRQIVWVVHWQRYDGSEMGLIDRAFTSEDEARWHAQTLSKLTDGSGRVFSLHSLPVYE
jgi:hypothetical protein